MSKSNSNTTNTGPSNLTPEIDFASLAFKSFVISLSVSAGTLPFQTLLTRVQTQPHGSIRAPHSWGIFHALYRGFPTYAIAGQKRGAICITSKQHTKSLEEKTTQETETNPGLADSRISLLLATLGFSQADILVANGLQSKSKLESAGVIKKEGFKWSTHNFLKLTSVNWGSRSVASFSTFSAMGFMGQWIAGLYKFNNPLYNEIAAGMTSGILATILTTAPNAYADHKLLQTTVQEDGCLSTVSALSMFRKINNVVSTRGAKRAATDFFKLIFAKEFPIRSIQSAVLFAIVFGVDHTLGDSPLAKLFPNTFSRESGDGHEKSCSM